MDVKAKTVRVLLVDDQESFRSAARLVIAMVDGFELVAEAETAEDGLRLASAVAADLVFMDINLPGIDGLEATRRLVAQSEVRVVVISTYEAAEYESRALQAGAVAFIPKSEFGPDILQDVLDQVPG